MRFLCSSRLAPKALFNLSLGQTPQETQMNTLGSAEGAIQCAMTILTISETMSTSIKEATYLVDLNI
jgi:hypothetical protein